MTLKTHHVTAYITMAITIALAALGTVQKDLPVVNDWLITTAIPNAITILGFAQEFVQTKGQGMTVAQATTAYQAFQNLKASFADMESKLKALGVTS